MDKQVKKVNNKRCYLIGVDNYGDKHYLREASWNCDWYWGFGYITDGKKDSKFFYHFENLIKEADSEPVENFREKFPETPLSNDEIWKLYELMSSFYTIRKYSDLCKLGRSHYADNPAKDTLFDESEYDKINKIKLPKIFDEIYKLLSE